MTGEHIMLSKKFDLTKITYPVYMTEKLDGVAAKFTGYNYGQEVEALSRQGEHLHSVGHISDTLIGLPDGHSVIGELYIPGRSFKEISGLVRRHEPCPFLNLFVYDYHIKHSVMDYHERRRLIQQLVACLGNQGHVMMIWEEYIYHDEKALVQGIKHFFARKPEAEGVVLRNAYGLDSYYVAGKRSWGMQKLKQVQTADLKVIGLEEAVSKDGEPLGMVGRIIVNYRGKQVGVGPGKMVHEDRTGCWKRKDLLIGQIIEVAYMPDPSYDAMREPRFIRMRPDKIKESYE